MPGRENFRLPGIFFMVIPDQILRKRRISERYCQDIRRIFFNRSQIECRTKGRRTITIVSVNCDYKNGGLREGKKVGKGLKTK